MTILKNMLFCLRKNTMLGLGAKIFSLVSRFNIKMNLEMNLKFGDGNGPNLCRVKKVDVSFIY